MRSYGGIPCFMSHTDRIHGFRNGSDLIEFDQNGITAAKPDSLFKSFCICYKQVIANQLYFTSKFLCEFLPPFPVFFVKTVLNRNDWVFTD